jgi:hypothetical protein
MVECRASLACLALDACRHVAGVDPATRKCGAGFSHRNEQKKVSKNA